MIEFVCDPALLGKIASPSRAGKSTPDWFRGLPREMGVPDQHGQAGMTAKACLPLTDAFSLGFVLPLPVDVTVTSQGYGFPVEFEWQGDPGFTPIESHHPMQIGSPNPPFGLAQPYKFINPWRLIVPEGYSVLFTQPLNHFELPFVTFNALVDCDRFETTVNIPFLWTGPVGRFELEAGTPIAQMVPIKRDSLIGDHVSRAATEAEEAQRGVANARKYGEPSTYARDWRAKK